ncbi:hypothetical protein TIFTF001_049180, partial [Ficus carica]
RCAPYYYWVFYLNWEAYVSIAINWLWVLSSPHSIAHDVEAPPLTF